MRLARFVVLSTAAVFISNLARADALDAPAGYYSTATGTGGTLRSQLATITTNGFVSRTYGDARYAMAILDRDVANPANILLAYNRASVSSEWDAGITYNREHVWPKSLLNLTSSQVSNTYRGVGSDLFELRPSNPSINSSRSNLPFGTHRPASGSLPTYGRTTSTDGSTYWYAGDADRGDVARSIFYVATRWANHGGGLEVVDGPGGLYRMGDRASMLRWHFADPVDAFERRRNQAIYSPELNPNYYQRNRNPFIDHPEYVWSIFGDGDNDSRLALANPSSDGASSASVDLGRVITGASFGSRSLTLTKSGIAPTTFDATVSGDITSTLTGPRQSFNYDAASRTFTVGLGGLTSTTGPRSGTLQINNTDLTSAGVGTGSADADDVVTLSGAVVSHAQPSFSSSSVVRSLTLDLGIVARGGPNFGTTVQLSNLGLSDAFVAGLDLDAITATGDASAFADSFTTFTNLAVGDARSFNVGAVTASLGGHAARFAFAVSDEDIPGATDLGELTLDVSSRIAIGGDATLDDRVNFADLVQVAQSYGQAVTGWEFGDFNRTGITDFADLVILAQNYGAVGDPSGLASLDAAFASDWALAQTFVPEPALLTAGASVSLLAAKRRRT